MTEPRVHSWIWAVYVLLFVVSVPWYLPRTSTLHLWFGLPHWVAISLAASLSIAVFTAWVIRHYWSEPESDKKSPNESTH